MTILRAFESWALLRLDPDWNSLGLYVPNEIGRGEGGGEEALFQ